METGRKDGRKGERKEERKEGCSAEKFVLDLRAAVQLFQVFSLSDPLNISTLCYYELCGHEKQWMHIDTF